MMSISWLTGKHNFYFANFKPVIVFVRNIYMSYVRSEQFFFLIEKLQNQCRNLCHLEQNAITYNLTFIWMFKFETFYYIQ